MPATTLSTRRHEGAGLPVRRVRYDFGSGQTAAFCQGQPAVRACPTGMAAR